MENKVRDIFPPKGFSDEPKGKLFKEKKEAKEPSSPFTIKWQWLLLLLVPFIFFIGSAVSKAEIRIWPKTNTVFYDARLTVDTEAKVTDLDEQVIPGQIFEVVSDYSRIFTASGKTNKRAGGVIRLYNSYSEDAENWLEGTRFISDEGKIFKSKGEIAVPGAIEKNGKIVPRYVDVPVIAAEPGEDYNINPSTFSIYVFRGTPKHTKFYGESLEPMAGGGEGAQVTESDLERAKEDSEEQAGIKAQNILKEKISSDFILLPDITEMGILESSSSAQIGSELENFNYDVKIRAAAIVFKKEDIEDFTRDFIIAQVPGEKLLYYDSLNIDYIPQIVDFEEGKVDLLLNFSGKIYPKVDISAIEKSLVGKSVSEAKVFLEGQSEFVTAEVNFWPFWVRKVPADLEKIQIRYPIIQ